MRQVAMAGDPRTGYRPSYHMFFFLGADQDELNQPAHFTLLEMTSRNQGSELSSAMMIPHCLW